MAQNGYHPSFLYGGYGYFDNMNHFFSSNGFAISDRSDIMDPTFANIWGVCDEDLFRHALDYFDGIHRQGHPFFSIIMTTSNHKPYTFPEGIEGVPAAGGGRAAGIRYADYALGRLFALAPEHAWYDNTLFVVVADHDARVYGRAQVPVERYRIPLLIYAPGQVSAGTVEAVTSQMDIAPTVLGLLGFPYIAPFYGQNVLNPAGADHPLLLNHNHDVAYIDGDRMVVLSLQGATNFFRYNADTDGLEPAEEDSALADRATAYYQTAFDLFKSHCYE
jgi:phosphoglycerol transferase MdoB-like AlkP superfamily enzyme